MRQYLTDIRTIPQKYVIPLLAATVFVLANILSVIILSRGNSLILYPIAALSCASGVYLAVKGLNVEGKYVDWTDRRMKLLHSGVFLGITALVIIGRMTGPERPSTYYLLYLLIFTLSIVGATARPSLLSISQILTAAFVARLMIIQSAPVLGGDSTHHIGMTGYILSTGDIVPQSVSYYHWFPNSHIEGAIISHVTGLSPKMGLFLPIAIGSLATLVLVYPVSTELSNVAEGKWTGAVAVSAVVIAWPHLRMTATPIAQGLNLVFVPIVLYVTLRPKPRLKFLLILVLVSLVFVHVLAPYVVTGLLVLSLIYEWSRSVIGNSIEGSPRSRTQLGIVAAILIVHLLYYHIYSDVINLQTGRIIRVFLGQSPVSQEISGGAILSATVLVELDPVLLFVGSLFVVSIFVVLSNYYLLERLWAGSSYPSMEKWVLIGTFTFGFAGVAHLVSSDTGISRMFAAALIISMPIIVVASANLRNNSNLLGALIVITLVVSGAFLGISNPQVSIAERTTSSEPLLLESDIAVVKFVNEYNIDANADRLLAGKEDHILLETGQTRTHISAGNSDDADVTVVARSGIDTAVGSNHLKRSSAYDSGSRYIVL